MARKKAVTRPRHKLKLNNRFLLVAVLFLIAFIIILKYNKTQLAKRPVFDLKSITTNAYVPDANETPNEEGLAIPRSVRGNSPGSKMKIRSFEVTAKDNTFSVNKIVVNQNDVISIRFTALDKTYDFTLPALGISQKADKGKTKSLEFQAIADGTFVFSCQSCGGNYDTLKGILVVVPN